MDVELVARRGLKREPAGEDLETLRALSHSRRIRLVEVLPGDAGVQVREHAGNRPVLAFVTSGHVEPQAILLDRTALTAGEVPVFYLGAGRRESRGFQCVGVVALDPATRHAAEVRRGLERVTA